MAISRSLYWLLWFLIVSPGLAIEPLEMEVASYSKDKSWENQKTFISKYSADALPFSTSRRVIFSDVENVAHSQYNWLVAENLCPSDKQTLSGECLVATFYDPITRMFYSSTVPQGPQLERMIEPPQARLFPRATTWWSKAKRVAASRQNGLDHHATPPTVNIHAEDGAFFYWETENSDLALSGKYPSGSILALWGKSSADAIPGHSWPCGGGDESEDADRVDCESRISSLNVKHLRMPASSELEAQGRGFEHNDWGHESPAQRSL